MKILVVLEHGALIIAIGQEGLEEDSYPFVYHTGRLN
jgi:hypothetical protein